MVHRLIILAVIIGFAIPLGAQSSEKQSKEDFHHCLFEENSFSIGLAIPYGYKVNAFGVNSRFYYNIRENICFGPEISYFNGKSFSAMDIDFVIHYIIETPIAGIYPVIGASYIKEIEEDHNKSALGVLWGGGIHRNVRNLTFFAEYTKVTGQLGDQFISSGLLYTIQM